MKYIKFIVGFLFLLPFSAHAANPSVVSFVAGSYNLSSGQVASLSWTLADAGGYSFIVPCVEGIKLKKIDGTVFPCNTSVSVTTSANDGIDLMVWNLSAGTKSFTARIIPKDGFGVDFLNGHQDIQISVGMATNIIGSMTGTTTIASQTPYSLSWEANLSDGVNLSLSCSPNIRTASSQYPAIEVFPCGTYVFQNGLAATGNLVLTFNNRSRNTEDVTLTLTPMMAPGVYNGAQTKSITVSVGSNILPDPVVTLFTASTTAESVTNDTPIPFSWAIANATSTNFLFSCNENISIIVNTITASSTPACGTLAFSQGVAASGEGTMTFSHTNYASAQITVTIIPGLQSGGFDATRGKSLTLRILPRGVSLATRARAPEPQPLATVTTTDALVPGCLPHYLFSPLTGQRCPTSVAPETSPVSTEKYIFTKNIARGSQGNEVRSLQSLLKKDSSIYPEGIVNGMFGPATERAVKRFQSKYGVGNPGTPGYGGVGPKTRSVLNSIE